MLINVTVYAVQIWFVRLKMVKQSARAQVDSNSFRVMLKTVASVMWLLVPTTMIVAVVFAVMANVRLPVEINKIVPMVNIVRIIVVWSNVQVTANVLKVRHVNKALVTLDVEATKTAVQINRVIIISVKIHVKIIFAAIMHCVKLKIMWQNVTVRPALKEIQRLSGDAFEFHRRVYRRADAPMDICALQIFAKYRAANQLHAPLENDAITMYALKFATQTTIACRVKFVMNVEHVKKAVNRKPIAHQRKSVQVENVNAVAVSLEHHSDALTLMSVPNKFAIRAPFARTHLDHSGK